MTLHSTLRSWAARATSACVLGVALFGGMLCIAFAEGWLTLSDLAVGRLR